MIKISKAERGGKELQKEVPLLYSALSTKGTKDSICKKYFEQIYPTTPKSEAWLLFTDCIIVNNKGGKEISLGAKEQIKEKLF